MAVMLDGVFYGTRAALRHMEVQGFGAIVNTASIGAFHPAPDYPFYAAAKAGVVAFTRSVGHEVAGAGIRVNAVAPGSTATAIMAGTDTGSFSSRNACVDASASPKRSRRRSRSWRATERRIASARSSPSVVRGRECAIHTSASTSRVAYGGQQCSFGSGPCLQLTAEDLDADDGVGVVGQQAARPLGER